jgi:selenide, water dikinase
VLRSIDRLDDAGVYKISEDIALIQTLDFITPIVNDPYTFGQIAAANSISDVYTMGGKPITAMNIVCFPSGSMDMAILGDILKGGLDKMQEAGVALMGGHSVTDSEMKYGLSVTGIVHPDKLITNSGTKLGDDLILTKPLGTGIMTTALKAKEVSDLAMTEVIKSMATLNRKAGELMLEAGVHACTDVTGFGLIGHASHLIQEGQLGIEFDFNEIPFFIQVMELLKKDIYPGGLGRNRDFYNLGVDFDSSIPLYKRDIVFDPQTSGGLLMAVSAKVSAELVDKLHEAGMVTAAVIGRVIEQPERKILVK